MAVFSILSTIICLQDCDNIGCPARLAARHGSPLPLVTPPAESAAMNAITPPPSSPHFVAESLRLGGRKVTTARNIDVFNPWNGELVGTTPMATVDDIRRAFAIGRDFK